MQDLTPFPSRYTAKELDEETGLYYYGARYYDPRTSVWQSADPILGSYLGGRVNGGIFNSRNLGLYTYSYHNPLVLVDPDGRAPLDSSDWTGREPLYTGKLGAPLCTKVLCNSAVYDRMDTSLATGRVGGAVQSDWFKAANIVTGIRGLGSLDVPNFMSGETDNYLTSVHHKLAKENYQTFNSLVSGEGYRGLSGSALDYALVDKEQALVTQFTNEYFGDDVAARDRAFAEINEWFDPENVIKFGAANEATRHVIKERFEAKGIKFDVGNEAHRKELGYGVVDYVGEHRERE